MTKLFYTGNLILAFMLVFPSCSNDDGADNPDKGNTPALNEEERALLASVNMDPDDIEAMLEAIKDQQFPNIHSVLINKDQKLVLEKYFRGNDQDWGSGLGIVQHSKFTLHDVRSISKSIVATCIGIAMDQGLIESVDQNIFDFFPDYEQYKTGLRADITIWHLLTMTPGFEWDEKIPYTNPLNSEIQMTNSSDPIEFVLGSPMLETPGDVFNYGGGATQLLAAIVKEATGKHVDEFASKYLFQPLGINTFVWHKYSKSGIPAAASGLRLRSGDLMKIAMLFQNRGVWEGNRIISKAWIEDSFAPHVPKENPGAFFGYHWHVLPSFVVSGKTIELVAGLGNGDQRIFFDKENDLVVVVTAGNYNLYVPNNALALTKQFIYPSFLVQ